MLFKGDGLALCELSNPVIQCEAWDRSVSCGSSAGFFSGPCLSLAAAQHESSGKQKHYGCHSVSYSGNTVLQLKSNDNKRVVASVCSARRTFQQCRRDPAGGSASLPRPSSLFFGSLVLL